MSIGKEERNKNIMHIIFLTKFMVIPVCQGETRMQSPMSLGVQEETEARDSVSGLPTFDRGRPELSFHGVFLA